METSRKVEKIANLIKKSPTRDNVLSAKLTGKILTIVQNTEHFNLYHNTGITSRKIVSGDDLSYVFMKLFKYDISTS